MKSPILAIVLAIVFSSTAAAQSSYMDLSKPMTGKTRFVVDIDGNPLEFGVPQFERIEKPVQSSSPAAPRGLGAKAKQDDGIDLGSSPCAGASCATDRSKGYATDRSKPVAVKININVRKDATPVQPPTKSAPSFGGAFRGRR